MNAHSDVVIAPPEPAKPAWGAVFSMSLGVLALVAAEFLPVSLLTPMAASLHVTEGVAGQTVAVTAGVGMLTSLLISAATRGIDRRWVLIAFSILLIGSNLLVGFADTLAAVLIGRVLLGVAVGGFWTMAAATAMRLVPGPMVPRALTFIFSCIPLGTITSGTIGTYLGGIVGWRNVFLFAAGLGVLALVWQLFTLPQMAPRGTTRFRTLLDVLRRPGVGLAMLACMLIFIGHFAFFTYLRPFLEIVTAVGITGLSAILLGFGVANFIGTALVGLLLEHRLRLTLWLMPLLLGLLALGLVLLMPAMHAVLVVLWGLVFGAVPVAWSTWITRVVPDEAETGSGLILAAAQLAIAMGAAVGGVIFDVSGARGVYVGCALILLLAAVVIYLRVRTTPAVATV